LREGDLSAFSRRLRTDRELLAAFANARDESALAALVARYGRLVQNVCRNVVGDVHDAEEAAQATFLVLARRASSLHKREVLAGWLQGAAYWIALRSLRAANRRRAREARERQLRLGGNLIEKSKGSGLKTWYYTYDNKNELLSVREKSDGSSNVLTLTYTYDAVGNQAEQDQWLSTGLERSVPLHSRPARKREWIRVSPPLAPRARRAPGSRARQRLHRAWPKEKVDWHVPVPFPIDCLHTTSPRYNA
jgi:DNA-directed RNA polymerase specialized sigma24 family protein